MQIYVPMPDAVETASILSNADLMEVIAACLRLIEEQHIDGEHTLLAKTPLYKMWDGHGPALCGYGLAMCDEIKEERGVQVCDPAILAETERQLSLQLENATSGNYTLDQPGWWGSVSLHHAHQSELLRNDPNHYFRFFHEVPMDLPPLWPAA